MKFWKKMIVAGAVLLAVGIETPVFAVDNNPPGYENIVISMGRKLGRGISNVAFGALEIPLHIAEIHFEEGGIAASTFGVLKGCGYFVVRECVGVFEIITFPIPFPFSPNDPNGIGAGWGPIMTPEWIITPETNRYNVVFPTSRTM